MPFQSDIVSLLSQWKERALNESYSDQYRDAVNDCIYELNDIVRKRMMEEAVDRMSDEDIKQYFEEIDADSYISSSEFIEPYYN
jgi:hypothetical protein